MKTELVDVSPTRKELKIEIEASEVRAVLEAISTRYARLATVPGFRKGHAPVSIVRQRFKNEIRDEVLQQLVPHAINEAFIEKELRVIGDPDVHFVDEESLNKLGAAPISLHAHVEVIPEVALGQYKGIEVARRIRPITDEQVEEVVQRLRESSAALQPVEERGAELGDTVTIDIQGRYLNPPSEEDINVEDVEVVLGDEGVVDEFNDHLLGVRPDEVKTFTVQYPEDFTSPGLAGKEIEYTATVSALARKELPELDDEWVQSLGEEDIETVEALRARVRQNLVDHEQFQAERRVRDEVLSKLVEAHQFEVPETLVDQQSLHLLRPLMRDLVERGLDPRQEGLDWDKLREAIRPRAIDDLRGSMLLDHIANEEKIVVTDEEIATEIESIAQATKQTPEQVRAALTKQGRERSIADSLRNRKALDLLIENANVRDEEWREEVDELEGAEAPVAVNILSENQAGDAVRDTRHAGHDEAPAPRDEAASSAQEGS